MSSTKPKESTIKMLFALCGNKCAFTGCTIKLVQDRNNLIGQICHIESRRPGGARYNQHSNDEERRSVENLIILCPTHHEIIDNDEDTYTVALLKSMKSQHELRNNNGSFELSDRELGMLMLNSGYYGVNFNWWRSTIIYNALNKLYLPRDIKACKEDFIKFDIFGENRKIVISAEADASGIYGSLYQIERQLKNAKYVASFDEVICFVFCDELLDGRCSRKTNHLILKKLAAVFFSKLNVIQQRYDFKISFVFLLEEESHEDKFIILPLVFDCNYCLAKCECIHLDLAEHYKFQMVNNWGGEVMCDCMRTRALYEYI